MASVTIYTRNNCGYCLRAKELLDDKDLNYNEINISDEPDRKDEMIERSGGQKTFPQIFFDGQHIGGCDDLYHLEEKGVLDTMIENNDSNSSSNEPEHRNVIILGSGSAGLTAAIYASRADLNPLVVEGEQPGGQLTITTDVENYPGFPEGVEGPELMDLKKDQAARFGTDFVTGNATEVDLETRPVEVTVGKDDYYTCKSLIIATGASAKWLGLDSEKEYQGKGVAACATCDGFFDQDEEVLVIGGGDTAMEEALFLTKYASRVRILHRRDELRASKILANRARGNDKIEFLWNTELIEVLGDGDEVTGARVVSHPDGYPKEKWDNNNDSVDVEELDCNGIFLGIGHTPNTGIFEGQLDMDDNGYINTGEEVETNQEGVFAAGDVQDTRYRQAVTAAGSGCKAAMEAEEYINQLKMEEDSSGTDEKATATAS
ncbi:MAG: thioredoxin-disulfide reductase [bacterium]